MVTSLVIAYLLGSIPVAILVSRGFNRPDPRLYGSGNVGAANVLRGSGPGLALTVALLDAAKGVVGVMVARHVEGGSASGAAVAAVVGHMYPLWLGFRGGKGVATACGAFSVLTPAAALVSLALFVAALWRTGYASAASLLATAVLPPTVYFTVTDPSVRFASLAAALLIVIRHRGNIARLMAGTEHRLDGRSARPEGSSRGSRPPARGIGD